MGVSDYVKKAEQHERLIEKEETLRESFSGALNTKTEAHMNVDLTDLLKELEEYRKDEVATEVARERDRWQWYCANLMAWYNEHFQPRPDSDKMEREMTKPNSPGYLTANND